MFGDFSGESVVKVFIIIVCFCDAWKKNGFLYTNGAPRGVGSASMWSVAAALGWEGGRGRENVFLSLPRRWVGAGMGG